jgi:hypothetical protein
LAPFRGVSSGRSYHAARRKIIATTLSSVIVRSVIGCSSQL